MDEPIPGRPRAPKGIILSLTGLFTCGLMEVTGNPQMALGAAIGFFVSICWYAVEL